MYSLLSKVKWIYCDSIRTIGEQKGVIRGEDTAPGITWLLLDYGVQKCIARRAHECICADHVGELRATTNSRFT
jgi:hypothetical protein